MRPTASEVLQSVIATYDEYIVPEVNEPFARSLALTTSNLLRHVLLRLEREGRALAEDNEELRELLTVLVAFMEDPASRARGGADFTTAAEAIRAAVANPSADGGGYRSLDQLAEEATRLRGALSTGLQVLVDVRDAVGNDESYRQLRNRVRRYLAHQLQRESQWIAEAFTGERR